MNQKIKKFFSGLFDKKIALVLLFFIILGITAPFYHIDAAISDYWETIMNYSTSPGVGLGPIGPLFWEYTEAKFGIELNPVNFILLAIFTIIGSVTFLFLSIAVSFLNWVIDPGFMSVGFVDNPIVLEGWGIVRDFTNMLIVLGFIFIALATIIGKEEYRAQKLLVPLIGVALLINFTLVITGFIIDISNVTMNYFLQGAGVEQGFVNNIVSRFTTMTEISALGGSVEKVLAAAVFAVFNIIAALIYFLYGLLFVARYVALWILIILSPLAFFAWIFPQLKDIIWKVWWSQFIQWSIIGIPAAFFLYLSNRITEQMIRGDITSLPSGDLSGFGLLFSYTIPIVFLFVGLLVSLKTSAIGAGGITSVASTVGKAGGKGVARWVGNKIKKSDLVEGTQEAVRRQRLRLAAKYSPTAKGRYDAVAENRQSAAENIKKQEEYNKHFSTQELRSRRKKLEEISFRGKKLRGTGSFKKEELAAIWNLDNERKKSRAEAFSEKELKFQVEINNREGLEKAKKLRLDKAGDIKAALEGEDLSAMKKQDEEKYESYISNEIKSVGRKMSPKNFTENVQAESFCDKDGNVNERAFDVFASMDIAKINHFGEHADGKKIEAVKDFVKANNDKGENILAQKIKEIQQKDPGEAKRLKDMVLAIKNNPNYGPWEKSSSSPPSSPPDIMYQ